MQPLHGKRSRFRYAGAGTVDAQGTRADADTIQHQGGAPFRCQQFATGQNQILCRCRASARHHEGGGSGFGGDGAQQAVFLHVEHLVQVRQGGGGIHQGGEHAQEGALSIQGGSNVHHFAGMRARRQQGTIKRGLCRV